MIYHACFRTEHGKACITVEAPTRTEALANLMLNNSDLRLHPSKITNVTMLR